MKGYKKYLRIKKETYRGGGVRWFAEVKTSCFGWGGPLGYHGPLGTHIIFDSNVIHKPHLFRTYESCKSELMKSWKKRIQDKKHSRDWSVTSIKKIWP